MPSERLSMRKIKEVLRLKWACGQSGRDIARACGIGRTCVGEYLVRASRAGLSWPLPDHLDDDALERLLFPPAMSSHAERPLPDYRRVHEELKRKGVTLALLWEEHNSSHPDAHGYSQFCELYRVFTAKLGPSMRLEHKAGEKMFVDYAGQTVGIVDRATGEVRPAQIFVAVLGASHYTFAEATWTQALPNWIGSHVRALTFFGGVTELIIPDNLRSAVSRACRYEPELNPTYREFAEHYGTAILPARVRRPKDKARVEAAVLLVERWLLACLRHRTFFSLDELNEAIDVLLERLNLRPFKKLPGCRRSQFEALDQVALKALPERPYTYAEWKKVRVHIDYHVEVEGHYYSVPYQLIQEQLEARVTAGTIECFHKSQRVASHLRSHKSGQHTTLREHMPRGHQLYQDWTPERLVGWAAETGEGCRQAVETILTRKVHPQQGFRSCLGLLGLSKRFSSERLEAACKRAVALDICSYKSVKSILEKGLDKAPLPESHPEGAPEVMHQNVRGATYFH